ncbi:hypothetical protein [Vagococcus hydrophili]|uniref:Uncharacterized protein n=1 Tax=Vagococcus hydrophili TaxID=2714947 RepID=A0A6G8AUV4_9ENTE|nr:hypothetical protein [Vagococcus hydrophili]QIL48749.1 hypothetical protein G7082_09640 [Vagococcus hydrophili]
MNIKYNTSYFADLNFVDSPKDYYFLMTSNTFLYDEQFLRVTDLLTEKITFSDGFMVEQLLETIHIEKFKLPIDYKWYSNLISCWADERTIFINNDELIIKELSEEEILLVAVKNNLDPKIKDILYLFNFQDVEIFLVNHQHYFSEKEVRILNHLYGKSPHSYYQPPDSMLEIKTKKLKQEYEIIKKFSLWKKIVITLITLLLSFQILPLLESGLKDRYFILEFLVIVVLLFLVSHILIFLTDKIFKKDDE